MGRPQKNNANYFPHDVNMRNDRRIKCLRKQYSHLGYAVYICLLETLCASDNFQLEVSDQELILVASDFDCSSEELSQIINFCVKIGLLNKNKNIITSNDLQQMLLPLISKRKKDRERIIAAKNSEKNNYRCDNIDDGNVFASNRSENTHSKEKKSKDNNSLRSSLSTSSPPSPAHARGFGSDDGKAITARGGVALLKQDSDWLQQMQRRHGISSDVIVQWLDSFVVECDCRGKQEHEDLDDVKQHFNDWLQKQKKLAKSGHGKQVKNISKAVDHHDHQKVWQQCYSEFLQAVSSEDQRHLINKLGFESYDGSKKTILLTLPSREDYDIFEEQLSSTFSRFLKKYFGTVTLNYRLLQNKTN